MPNNIWLEIVGYVGMALVVVSFFFTNMMWLRILNLGGAVLCCVYGFVTKTYPTAALNAFLIVINTVMLIRIFVHKKRDQNNPDAPSKSEGKAEEGSAE